MHNSRKRNDDVKKKKRKGLNEKMLLLERGLWIDRQSKILS